MGVVSADAFAVGISAVPKPFDDIDWSGWMWHWSGALHAPTAAQLGDPSSTRLIEIDSKAMRKLSINDVLFAIVQVGEVGVAAMTTRIGSRILLKVTEQ